MVEPVNQIRANVSLRASSSYLTELVRGMTLEEASKVKNTEIAKELVRKAPPRHEISCANGETVPPSCQVTLQHAC